MYANRPPQPLLARRPGVPPDAQQPGSAHQDAPRLVLPRAALLLALVAVCLAVPAPASAAFGDVTQFPVPAAQPGASSQPTGVDGASDAVWFADFGKSADRLGRLTPTGELSHVDVPGVSGLSDVSVASDNSVWFAQLAQPWVGRLHPDGRIDRYDLPADAISPYKIVAHPDGGAWFVERDTDRIGRVTPQGEVVQFPLPQPAGIPHDLTVGPDGGVWYARGTEQGVIGRVTDAGEITEFQIPLQNVPDVPGQVPAVPFGITAGPDGNLWFVLQGTNQVGRITPAGEQQLFSLPPTATPPSDALNEITVGADGNLWFTQAQSAQLGRITPAGEVTEFPLPGNPDSLVTGPDGALWITASDSGTGDGVVYRFDIGVAPVASPTPTSAPTPTPAPTPALTPTPGSGSGVTPSPGPRSDPPAVQVAGERTGDRLPFTGASTALLLGVGGGLMVLGAMAVLAMRRRGVS